MCDLVGLDLSDKVSVDELNWIYDWLITTNLRKWPTTTMSNIEEHMTTQDLKPQDSWQLAGDLSFTHQVFRSKIFVVSNIIIIIDVTDGT